MKSTTAGGTNSPGASRRPGVAEHAQLQREAQLVAGTPPGPDVLQVFVAQGVVAQQVGLALRKGNRADSAGLSERFLRAILFLSTYARHRIRHGIRHTEEPAGTRLHPHVPNPRLRHMLIGYARVSKADGSQSLDLQQDALRAEGVEATNLYHDIASGVRDDGPDSTAACAPCAGATCSSSGSSTVSAATRPSGQHRAGPVRPAAWAADAQCGLRGDINATSTPVLFPWCFPW